MSSPSSFIFGVTHVDLGCTDIARSRKIYEETLGFPLVGEGEGYVDLDACGTIVLRLIQVSRPEHRGTLRVQTADVPAAVKVLLRAGCKAGYPVEKTAQTLAGTVSDPDGHMLWIWRPLTEDEYDVAPELPKQMRWDADAEVLLQQVLKSVPAFFRGLARRRVTKEVEALAAASGHVGREEVIRGIILSSPKITRHRNRQPLIDAGVDVDQYQADWDAD